MPERISFTLFTVFLFLVGSVPHCGTISRRPAEQIKDWDCLPSP
jgi:hypothetical protein